jgi:26S proteasome regulatory subunit T5
MQMVRDAFELAKEKCKDRGGAIIFIDEVRLCLPSLLRRSLTCTSFLFRLQIDAIGTKRFDSDQSGDREVQRTMLELLNQLDGFSSGMVAQLWLCQSTLSITSFLCRQQDQGHRRHQPA